jgi:hypothetical protein
MEKDELMHHFYTNGSFPSVKKPEHWEMKPSASDWAMVLGAWASLIYTVPIYLSIITLTLYAIFSPIVRLFY